LEVSPPDGVELAPAPCAEAAPAELAPLAPLLPNKPGSAAPPQPKIAKATALGANK
jgi:hypothetical protein